MLRYLLILALFSSSAFVWAQETTVKITIDGSKDQIATTKPPFKGQRPAVDVAILLDTSNSMDGLIGQAKSQLWTIVQQFAAAKKQGKTPLLRVSVFEYGNTRLPASEGYIRQVIPLTDNLDKVSEALFALTTQGGDEYCGQVIDEAIARLDWSQEPNSYKAIFIAGNEPFTQGSVDYRKSCPRAIEAGIVVNTIHCGNYEAGVNGKWQDGAQLAEGEYFNIDQDRKVVHVRCPQDKIIIELNAELNETYLWYGKRASRHDYSENQLAQDANAEASAGLAGRVATKAGRLYRNVGRDLVDTFEEDETALEEVAQDELPDKLQSMNRKERLAYIESMAKKRAGLKQKIVELNRQREAYLAEERQRRAGEEGEATLGDAVVGAIRKQLVDSGFELKEN